MLRRMSLKKRRYARTALGHLKLIGRDSFIFQRRDFELLE